MQLIATSCDLSTLRTAVASMMVQALMRRLCRKYGHKRGHWIWYVFPQMKGLGHSEISEFYGINGREEAKAYIEHPVLRERLVEICEAVLNSKTSVYDIFGQDTIKVRACILLFASVCDIPVFKQLKSKYRW